MNTALLNLTERYEYGMGERRDAAGSGPWDGPD